MSYRRLSTARPRTVSLIAALSVTTLTVFPPCPAQTPSPTTSKADARAAIAATYDQISAAYQRRDLDCVMSYFAPDYVEVDPKGTRHDRGDVMHRYQGLLRQIHTMQTHYVMRGVTATNGGSFVDMQMHSDGTGEKRLLFARLRGTFTNDLVVRDLWVETPRG